tara:strand:+ start:1467 stop:1676 length:210 start_codon:yes stop_codon:yes gene_type:complete
VKPGDLVKLKKASFSSIGIVVEIFDDINKVEPWVRVLFTHPVETYQWVKMSGLMLANDDKDKGGLKDPP